MPRKNANTELEVDHYVLPPPLEIAKLSILLDQLDEQKRTNARTTRSGMVRVPQLNGNKDFTTRNSIIKAVRFYLETVQICEEISELSDEGLALLLSGQEVAPDHLNKFFRGMGWLSSSAKVYALYDDDVRLNPQVYKREFINGIDPARDYLQRYASIYNWKRSSTVRNTILKFFQGYAQQYNLLNASSITEFQQVISKMAAEMKMSEDAILSWKFSNDRRRPLSGKDLYERFMKIVSIKEELRSSTIIEGGPKILGWSLTSEFLNTLIAWRNAQKKFPGGIKRFSE